MRPAVLYHCSHIAAAPGCTQLEPRETRPLPTADGGVSDGPWLFATPAPALAYLLPKCDTNGKPLLSAAGFMHIGGESFAHAVMFGAQAGLDIPLSQSCIYALDPSGFQTDASQYPPGMQPYEWYSDKPAPITGRTPGPASLRDLIADPHGLQVLIVKRPEEWWYDQMSRQGRGLSPDLEALVMMDVLAPQNPAEWQRRRQAQARMQRKPKRPRKTAAAAAQPQI